MPDIIRLPDRPRRDVRITLTGSLPDQPLGSIGGGNPEQWAAMARVLAEALQPLAGRMNLIAETLLVALQPTLEQVRAITAALERAVPLECGYSLDEREDDDDGRE